jgi:hypothetical protein
MLKMLVEPQQSLNFFANLTLENCVFGVRNLSNKMSTFYSYNKLHLSPYNIETRRHPFRIKKSVIFFRHTIVQLQLYQSVKIVWNKNFKLVLA